MIEKKTCTKCKIEKDISFFSKPPSRGKYLSRCKSCVASRLSTLPKETIPCTLKDNRRKGCSCPKCESRRKQKRKNLDAKNIGSLSDRYIKTLLSKEYSLDKSQITSDLITMKREQLSLKRLAKNMSDAAEHGKENNESV